MHIEIFIVEKKTGSDPVWIIYHYGKLCGLLETYLYDIECIFSYGHIRIDKDYDVSCACSMRCFWHACPDSYQADQSARK